MISIKTFLDNYAASDSDFILEMNEAACIEYYSTEELAKREFTIPLHLLIIPINGKKQIFSDHWSIDFGSGEAAFIKAGSYCMSHITSLEHGSYQAMAFFLTDTFLEQFILEHRVLDRLNHDGLDESAIELAPALFKLEKNSFVDSGIQSLFPHFEQKESLRSEEFVRSILKLKVHEILLALLSSSSKTAFLGFLAGLKSKKHYALNLFMEKNFTKNLTLPDFAKSLGMSLSSFKKLFQLHYHAPPKRWINSKRLDRAYFLLLNSNRSVSDIALDVGFQNLSYFITNFKDRFQITPKQLQKNENW